MSTSLSGLWLLLKFEQALSATGVSPTDPYRYSAYEHQTQPQPQSSEYHYPPRTESFPQYQNYTDSAQTFYGEPHDVYASSSIAPKAYPERASVSSGSSTYPASAIRTTNVPLHLHAPHPVPAASALLSPSYAPSTASHYLPSEHHLSMSSFDGPRRMSVPELHGQHYQTGYVQSPSFHLEASRRMSVPNLHHHSEAGNSYGASTSRPSPSYLNQPATAEPSLVYGSQNYEPCPTSSSTGSRAQLAPQGSGADLMEYYANLNRESFQTPCQLLDSLLKTGPSASGHSQVDAVPVEPAREEKKQTETSRQARLRYMSESVGFQPTDPYVLVTAFAKRRHANSSRHIGIRCPVMRRSVTISSAWVRVFSSSCYPAH